MSEKQSAILGWIGTLLSVIMYVSYVPQIINNLHGMKGTPIQPLAAAVNCTIWVIYSLTKKNRIVTTLWQLQTLLALFLVLSQQLQR